MFVLISVCSDSRAFCSGDQRRDLICDPPRSALGRSPDTEGMRFHDAPSATTTQRSDAMSLKSNTDMLSSRLPESEVKSDLTDDSGQGGEGTG